jgi:hypothetical protein
LLYGLTDNNNAVSGTLKPHCSNPDKYMQVEKYLKVILRSLVNTAWRFLSLRIEE